MLPPRTPPAWHWWRFGRSAKPRAHRAKPGLKWRGVRKVQQRRQRWKPKLSRAASQKPPRTIRSQGSSHLRIFPDLRMTRASIVCRPSSNTRYYGTQGHATPCPRNSCSHSWWPHANCDTTCRATQSKSSQLTHWRGYLGALTRPEGSLSGTSSCKHSSWSSALPGSSKGPHSLTLWQNGRMPRYSRKEKTSPPP